MRAFFIRLLISLIALLPLGLARGAGKLFGQIAWSLRTRSAKTTLTNLKLCFPDKSETEIKSLAQQSMQHWGMTVFEIPLVWKKGHSALDWVVKTEGVALIDKALEDNRGIIYVGPHHGNWELLGFWIPQHGDTTILYQPPRRFELDSVIKDVRTKSGSHLVPTNIRGVVKLKKALMQGKQVGILPDMVPDARSGVYAPFFNIPTLTMTLIHKLQQDSGAKILVCFAKRVKGGFELIVSEPEAPIYDSDAVVAVTELNRSIENLVLMAPEQYQWEYKRFKRQPDGQTNYYSA